MYSDQLLVPALQAGLFKRSHTQGDALGYVVTAFQAEEMISQTRDFNIASRWKIGWIRRDY
jgi:hypothetical protein